MTTSADPFTGLTAFITAAQWNSFSVAARKLGLTPSAVSKSVSRLEASLGVRLFHRSPRVVTLTPAGQAYYDECSPLFQQASDARAMVTGRAESSLGKLRVCLPVSFGLQRLAGQLPQWQQDHPDTQLEIILSDRNVDLVQERFDLAVRFHDVPDSRLIARALKPPRFLTVASPGYLAGGGTPQTPRDLADHNCLAYLDSQTGVARPWRFQPRGSASIAPRKSLKNASLRSSQGASSSTSRSTSRSTCQGSSPGAYPGISQSTSPGHASNTPNKPGHSRTILHQPRGNLVSDQGIFLLNCALADGGILHAPDYLLADALGRGDLVTILDAFEGIGPPWWMVYQASRFPSPRLRSFVEFILAQDQAS